MRILFPVWVAFIVPMHILAQSPLRNANAALTYRIQSNEGTNACGLAYNAKNGLYYTVFAGNTKYPLEAFDNRGQNKYAGEIGLDVRSLWFNAKKKVLEGMAFPQKGKFTISINNAGIPTSMKEPGNETFSSIPETHSTACPVGKDLYYFDGKQVYVLNGSNYKQKSKFTLKSIPGDISHLNNTTLIYTGKKGFELGFYDSFEGKVYFTDLKGNYSGTTLLPSSAPQATAFRFSYANDMLWLYDASARIWYAYFVF